MPCGSNPSTGSTGTGGLLGPEEHFLRLSSGLHMAGVRAEMPSFAVDSSLDVYPQKYC